MSKRNGGFTLVELVIVIVIIGILAAIAVPKFTDTSESAKLATMQASLAAMRAAINMSYAKNAAYPEDITGDMFAEGQVPLNVFNNRRTVDVMNDPASSGPGPVGAVYPGWWYNAGNGMVGYYTEACNDAITTC